MKEIEDLSKPKISEGNHSPDRRDEPLVDPLDEEEFLNLFAKKSIASRFLSGIKGIGKRLKRALSKLRFTQDPDASAEFDSSESTTSTR